MKIIKIEVQVENNDDKQEIDRMLKATDMALALLKIVEDFRRLDKYGEDDKILISDCRTIVQEALDSYGIDLNSIIS